MITVRHILIKKLHIPNVGDCTVEIENLSSNLALNDEPMTLSIKNKETGFDVFGKLDFVTAEMIHILKVNAPDLPVAAMGLTDKCPINISDARADLSFNGQFNSKMIDFPITVVLRELKSTASGEGKILGLKAGTFGDMLGKISTLTVSAGVSGAVDRPKVHVDAGKTVASLVTALKAVGADMLAGLANEQLQQLFPGGLPVDVKGILSGKMPTSLPGMGDINKLIPGKGGKSPLDVIPGKDGKNPLDALKGVIPGKDGGGATTKPKDPAGGLLDGLRL